MLPAPLDGPVLTKRRGARSFERRGRAALALAIVALTMLIVATGALSYSLDENARAEAFQRLRTMALHDGLTALPNRSYFRERLDRQVGEAAAAGAKVALIAFDLDGFKDVNDQFGHAAGDLVLRRLSQRLKARLKTDEFGGRLGGDEFAVAKLYREDADLADLLARLTGAFIEPLIDDAITREIGASIGVAIFPKDAGDAESLVNNADLAMYCAKAETSKRVVDDDRSMDERLRRRRRLADELRAAIAGDELEVHYQPQVDIRTGAICGFEALARWPRENGGPVSPAEFIPVAEEYGLIDALGEWVLRRACVEASGWRPPCKVAVNLSPLQLRRPDLSKRIEAVLRETGLPPQRLELELTEFGGHPQRRGVEASDARNPRSRRLDRARRFWRRLFFAVHADEFLFQQDQARPLVPDRDRNQPGRNGCSARRADAGQGTAHSGIDGRRRNFEPTGDVAVRGMRRGARLFSRTAMSRQRACRRRRHRRRGARRSATVAARRADCRTWLDASARVARRRHRCKAWPSAAWAASANASLWVGWAWIVAATSSSRAPISIASANAADSSRHAGADRLHAEHDMVVLARDDADETLVVLQRHRPAVGAERETAPVRISPCAARAASGDRPTATISGSVKQTAGIARWSKARFCRR